MEGPVESELSVRSELKYEVSDVRRESPTGTADPRPGTMPCGRTENILTV